MAAEALMAAGALMGEAAEAVVTADAVRHRPDTEMAPGEEPRRRLLFSFGASNRGAASLPELQALPTMTSVALMRAMAQSPGLRASSRTASAVMMAVTRCPPTEITTFAKSPSTATLTTLPRS